MIPSRRAKFYSLGLSVVLWVSATAAESGGPFQATGFKVGEVTDRSAIVWTRLTRFAEHNPSDGPMVKIEFEGPKEGSARRARGPARPVYPDGVTVADIRDAVPGAEGDVRVRYQPDGASDWTDTDWQPVHPQRD